MEEGKSESDDKKRDSRELNSTSGRQSSRRPGARSGAVVVDIEERVVSVNRCAKVVKGGRRFSFSALIVVGDKKGKVGYGLGKAKEVPEAIRKAKMIAQNKMVSVCLEKGTIPHRVLGEFDAGKILLMPAGEGTGIKAAGACRNILELAGVRNILTKSLRGNNPHNVVKATFKALRMLRSAQNIADIRGKELSSIRL